MTTTFEVLAEPSRRAIMDLLLAGERPGGGLVSELRTPPPAGVWRALTEEQHLAAWFPTTIDGERAAGAKLSFAMREMEMPPMEGQMLAFDPPSLLELAWGEETLRFELAADGAGTLLRF